MKTNQSYIPALRWHVLTPFYDPILRWIMREEYFKREMIQQAQIHTEQTVLDLGCGTATLTVMIKKAYPEAIVTGLDGDPEILQIARAKAEKASVNITFDQGFAFGLTYPDNSFDRVFSSLMFHHLTTPDKQQTMKEIIRVLRPGGQFILVDFGPPHGLWAHIISPVMARLEHASDNHKGLLMTMMGGAGFKAISDKISFPTIFGTLHLYKSRK